MSLTKISDYMKLSQEDRQKHIDLSTECEFHYFERDWGSKKEGDLYSKREQMKKAKEELLKKLGIEEFGGSKIHLCHLCDCNSNTDKVCINHDHLYFGTVSENMFDIPFEVMSERGKKTSENMTKEQLTEWASKAGKRGGKKCAELGKSGFKQKVKCPHCNKEGSLAIMHRWHLDNCKHKPVSTILPDISSFIPETVSPNLE